MALSATTVFEVRTTGSDLNGGGYNPSRSVSGVDRSQQDAAHVVIDGVTISSVAGPTSGANITLTGHTVADADLGNLVNISGVCYEITAVNAGSNYWTLDRDTGASVDMPLTGRMGGALATPGKAGSVLPTSGSPSSYPTIWITGTHQITSSSSNVSNGRLSLTTHAQLRGYGSSRGDGEKATLNAAVASISVVTVTSVGVNAGCVRDIAVTNTGANAGVTGFDRSSGSGSLCMDCSATACSIGFNIITNIRCIASSGTTGFTGANGQWLGCVATGNSSHGFAPSNTALKWIANCISYSNGGAGFVLADGGNMSNCVSYGNTSHGISVTGGSQNGFIVNCLLVNNGGAAESGSLLKFLAINNATFNNTGGAGFSGCVTIGNIALTSNPFTDAAGGNFALNSTAGGGAACRAAGIPGAFPGGTTTGYLDIGAAQHQDSGGYPGINRGALIR